MNEQPRAHRQTTQQKYDRHSMRQEATVISEHTSSRTPETVSNDYTTIALCLSKESHKEITQPTTKIRAENVSSETTDILTHEAIIEVPLAEFAFSVLVRTRYELESELTTEHYTPQPA